jgi:para-aminobenzoate synthetase / 4-amino-4-deoxychorismate lyase
MVQMESFSSGDFKRSFRFCDCETVITAHSPDQVIPALAAVEQAVARGRHAAGYVAYDAAAGLNPDLPVSGQDTMPLVWFGIFAQRLDGTASSTGDTPVDCTVSPLELALDKPAYLSAVGTIREAIGRGETYQVNFTTRQRFQVDGDPFTLYRRMCRNQQSAFCAWLDLGTRQILSASPELFFALDGDLLTMRPMKGTAPRMPRSEEDLRQRDALAASDKERAENLMIVDLVRNDLSRIAGTGTVAVPSLFDVETYPTVHQMTSTVTARLRPEVGLTGIFQALFPCGSVTGAPKRRSMEIIAGLETVPRGVYCGAIGYVSPGREAVFSVAIRTAVIDTATGKAEIGIGSGITWGSDAGSEFEECLAKGAFLTRCADEFSLIETIRHDREGYLLLERHLRRLAGSAAYFGFSCDIDQLRSRLSDLGATLDGAHKVRILLASDGTVRLEAALLLEPAATGVPREITVSHTHIDPADPFLYHKTTRRELYEQELRDHPDFYDVIFLNQLHHVTEGCFNSIVVSIAGELLTPALECGLLPGLLRAELIEVGAVREAVLTLDDLQNADRIWLVNSVRGWRECTINQTHLGEYTC